MNLSFRGPLNSLMVTLLSAAAAVAGLGLSACKGAVGSGNAPQTLVIAAPNTITQLTTLQMYQCLTSGLRALLYFTNGSVGDYTARVVWSTSNPGAVQVSNGDIPIAGTSSFYPSGTLVPTGAGNAVITADYFGIQSALSIGVDTPQDINLKAIYNGAYIPLAKLNLSTVSTTQHFSMAAGSTVQLAATAKLSGVETDITKFATLGFQNPSASDSNIATINPTTAVLTAVADSGGTGPLVPEATFPPCDLTSITNTANITPFQVYPATSLSLVPQFPPTDPTNPPSVTNPVPPLVVGNSERFIVAATLANGDVQDVSTNSTLTSQNTAAAIFGGTTGVNNLLTALVGNNSTTIFAVFTGAGTNLTSNSYGVGTLTATLNSLTTCYTDIYTQIQSCPTQTAPATVQAGTLTPVQFHAFGDYGNLGVNGSTGAFTQEITRITNWSILTNVPGNTTTVATISNAAANAGQALGVNQGSVNINAIATAASGTQLQQITQLVVTPLSQQ